MGIAGEVVAQEAIHIVYGAVFDDDVAGLLQNGHRKIRQICKCGKHIDPVGSMRLGSVSFLFYAQTAAEKELRRAQEALFGADTGNTGESV